MSFGSKGLKDSDTKHKTFKKKKKKWPLSARSFNLKPKQRTLNCTKIVTVAAGSLLD